MKKQPKKYYIPKAQTGLDNTFTPTNNFQSSWNLQPQSNPPAQPNFPKPKRTDGFSFNWICQHLIFNSTALSRTNGVCEAASIKNIPKDKIEILKTS